MPFSVWLTSLHVMPTNVFIFWCLPFPLLPTGQWALYTFFCPFTTHRMTYNGHILGINYTSCCMRDEKMALGFHNLGYGGQWCGERGLILLLLRNPRLISDRPCSQNPSPFIPSHSLSSLPIRLTYVVSTAFWQSLIQSILLATIHSLKVLLSPYCFPAPNLHRFPTVYRIKSKSLHLRQRNFCYAYESCLWI